jgi:hypothetical protein
MEREHMTMGGYNYISWEVSLAKKRVEEAEMDRKC